MGLEGQQYPVKTLIEEKLRAGMHQICDLAPSTRSK